MATTQATNQTPNVDSQRWTPFELNYNVTKGLWNKETSDNCMLAAAQKVVYLAGAVFTAVLESLQNFVYAIGNGFIGVANGINSYFADKSVEQVKTETEQPKTTERPVPKPIVEPTLKGKVAIRYNQLPTAAKASAETAGSAAVGASLGYAFSYTGLLTAGMASGIGAAAAAATYLAGKYVAPVVVEKYNAWKEAPVKAPAAPVVASAPAAPAQQQAAAGA